MKASRITKYSLLIFVLLTALSTFTSMLIGVDNLAAVSFTEYFVYQLMPSFILTVAMYAFMAKRDSANAWSYAVTVFLIALLLGNIVISLLMQGFQITPTWFIELPLSVFSTVVGTLIGIKLALKSAASE